MFSRHSTIDLAGFVKAGGQSSAPATFSAQPLGLFRSLLSAVLKGKISLASMRNLTVITLAIALLFMSACRKQQETVAEQPVEFTGAATERSPRALLRISVLPTQNAIEQRRMIAPLEAHLEQTLGQPVDFLIAKDYQDNVDMLLDGRANAAYTGAVSYLEAVERGARVVPLVAPIDKFTARPWYRACIIVRADSSIQSLGDLRGKRVAFVNRSSTSGYLMPLIDLRQAGIEPERDFAAVVFGGTHSETEALLEQGKVDAVATNIPSYIKRQSIGNLTPSNSRVIWSSAPVPHSPFLVSQDLPPELVERLKEAFLTVPPGVQDIVGTQAVGYTLTVPSDYDSIRQLRSRLNRTAESY